MLNRWDGSLTLDEENNAIMAAQIAAGKKNSDNTFSGVIMGDWGHKNKTVGPNEESISKQTGVYGFHHGDMSFAFREDGTAFIGKDGRGRIEFNGNTGKIESSRYKD
jgi:hypothetical protein